MRRLVEESRSGEGGAILVMSALLIIVLLGFAALTVDLGYAWAERRTSQNTADAVVMAGGIEYLASGAASNADVIAVMKDYANRNDAAFTDGDWVESKDQDPDGQSTVWSVELSAVRQPAKYDRRARHSDHETEEDRLPGRDAWAGW